MSTSIVHEKRPHVVVLGGGFGGLYATKTLAKAAVTVTVVDSRNHHLFQPLLYQVATAALSPGDIAVPIRRILRSQANATVVLAKALSVDTQAKRVTLDEGEIDYDYLVVATGATHSYFGHDAWQEFAPGLKSIEDALDIRRRVLVAYEEAERETDPAVQKAWLTFVVVGGGPTGVELAGALAEISRHVLDHDFRRIDPKSARVILVEAGPRILPTFEEASSAKASEQLSELGAEVLTHARVTGIDASGVTLEEQCILARTVLWGAGVTASPLATTMGIPLDRAGRVRVLPDLSAPGAPDVFVIGDLAALEQNGKPVPGVAPAAMQEGRHAAQNILRKTRGDATLPFHYTDKGSLATIGRASAVAEIGSARLSGLLAWLAWLFIHILFLIGFRNRYLVLSEWAWGYVTYERGARLITGGKRAAGPPALP
jgi:NADH:ubiquinone reductase (H+-translocating)